MAPIHNNFISWWQPNMLIIEQPDKMLRDITANKVQSYLLSKWKFWSVARCKMFQILVFHSSCRTTWPRYEIQQSHCFLSAAVHTSCKDNHNILPFHNSSLCRLQVISSFTNVVPYHPWIYSIILKPKLHSFVQSEHLNWYRHHQSPAEGETLFSGEISFPYNKPQFNF